MSRRRNSLAQVVLALALSGCAAGGGPSPLAALLTAPSATGAVSTASTSATILGYGSSPTVKGTPIDVYERVARGALRCWFGGQGPLKKSHIFNAEAAPPSSGGSAEITVHERDGTQPSPRGTRVFRIWFARESDKSTRVTLQAAKLPQDLADAMERDALAWAAGKDSCDAQIARPPPPPDPEPAKAKRKVRATTVSR